jgi:hypothetical protein
MTVPSAKRHVDAIDARIEGGDRGGPKLDARSFPALTTSASIRWPVFDHMRERLAGFDIAGKGQEHRSRRVVEFGIGHHHV